MRPLKDFTKEIYNRFTHNSHDQYGVAIIYNNFEDEFKEIKDKFMKSNYSYIPVYGVVDDEIRSHYLIILPYNNITKETFSIDSLYDYCKENFSLNFVMITGKDPCDDIFDYLNLNNEDLKYESCTSLQDGHVRYCKHEIVIPHV